MASNQNKGTQGGTPEQHAAAGRQSHKNDANKQSGAGSGSRSGSTASSGTRGGTPEQHAAAGRQSHKNDGNKQSGSNSGSRSGSYDDAMDQLVDDGRQSQNQSRRSSKR